MFCPKCGVENLYTSKFCKKCGKNLPDASQIRQVSPPQFGYAPPSQTGNLLGQILDGKYRIEALLGTGGMGDVYRATRMLIGDSVAIKILHPHLARDAQAAERFRREAVTATQLRHRNIVALYDVGISAAHNVPFILMELAEGFSLRQIINQYRVLPLDFVVTVTAQLCAALDEAHRLGIVHRDIKPENIIANQTANGWHVKVLDFGIAKLYNQTDLGLTQDGSAMGTPQYMSPEQCLGEALDGRSDIYSVGILLYEMLAGTVPFKSPAASAIAVHQVQTPPAPPSSLNSGIAPQVEAVVLRALDKRREQRPQTASQLAQEMIQAATVAFKAGIAPVSATPIAAPNVRREFEATGEPDAAPDSHTLSSEILVEKKSPEKEKTKIKFGKKIAKNKVSGESIAEEAAQKTESADSLASLEDHSEETDEREDRFEKEDLSLVFEDAEHILDEMFPIEKKGDLLPEAKSADALQTGSPMAETGDDPAEFEGASPDVLANSQAETVILDQVREGKADLRRPTEAQVDPPAGAVVFDEIRSEPKSRNVFIFGAIGLCAVFVLAGMIGLWYLVGGRNAAVPANNDSAAKKPQPPAGMVLVAGGSFTMGGDDQIFDGQKFTSPPHDVTVRPFFMDIYEVTCEDYKKFLEATDYPPPKGWNGKNYPAGAARFPVTNVNWDAANAYAKWAGKRLPTETEWEFAARETDRRLYSWGNDWKEGMANANHVRNGMVEVGTFKGASPSGIYDLIGNAWEWTSTTLEPYPNGQMPKIKPNVDFKIIRGGSWESDIKSATTTRRGFYGARDEKNYENTSFRCVKDLTENQ